jgi:tetratricopeptide (TPR) repeat protein
MLADLKALNASSAVGRERRRVALWLGLAACGAALVISTLAYLYRPRPSPRLTDKDTVLLADFTNHTGDSVWDDTLKQWLRVELDQSPYLNIMSDEDVTKLLRYAGRSPNERVTEELGLELCQRAASKAMLVGSITSVGRHYDIELKAVNCENNEPFAEEGREANSQEEVLTKLHDAGVNMRGKLGESLASIKRYNIPVEQDTTPSLRAFEAYSEALKAIRSRGDNEGLPWLKRAVGLDPDFAMAYAVLGTTYSNLGDDALAAKNTSEAYQLRDRVTERERFFIDSSYYNMATGELSKEIEVYEQWKQAYPRDHLPHEKLAYCDGYLGQYDKAVAEYRNAIALDPGNVVDYVDLAGTYITLDRLDDAGAVLDELQRRNLEHEYVPLLSYLLAFMRDDRVEIEKLVSSATSNPASEDIIFAAQSDTEAFHGRLGKARDFLAQAVHSALQNGARARASEWRAHAALWEAELGNSARARREAMTALAMAPGDVEAVAALALARAGDAAGAGILLRDLTRRAPSNMWMDSYWLPSIRAAIEIDRKNPARAIHMLQIAEPYEFGGDPITLDTLYPVYLRAHAYLMEGDGKRAVAEFQKILEHHGRNANGIIEALVHLELGRAYALSSDSPKAQSAYQDFLALWKDADPDALPLRQARAEYARMHRQIRKGQPPELREISAARQ